MEGEMSGLIIYWTCNYLLYKKLSKSTFTIIAAMSNLDIL